MSIEDFISNATKTAKKQSKVKEVSIEDGFCAYAKTQGCLPFKLIILNRRGWPDRSVLCPGGKVLFIEFKRDKNSKPSANQVGVRTKLEKLGFTYHVCWDLEDAKALLDDFLL